MYSGFYCHQELGSFEGVVAKIHITSVHHLLITLTPRLTKPLWQIYCSRQCSPAVFTEPW